MALTRLAAVGATLFLARLLAEAVVLPWYGVLVIAAAAVALGLALARARLLGEAYPALALWPYVLWPWRDPWLAAACGTVALLALAVLYARRSRVVLPRYAVEIAVFLGALAVYTVTLSPGLLPADAGEFQLVAARLMVAHPPGYPLYTLGAKAFALLPLASVAWRVNWFSAVTAAATLALAAGAVRRLSGSAWGGLAAALVLGTCVSYWATATQASIRPLAGLFTAAMVALAASVNGQARDDRRLTLFALAFGLGIGHHVSLAFTGVFLALYMLRSDPALLRAPRRWLAPLGALVLSLAVFAYLPLANAALRSPGALLDYVLARGFAGDMLYFVTQEPALLGDRLALLPGLLGFEFTPLALLAAAIGFAWLARHHGRLALALGAGWLVHTFMTLTYRAPQTVEYMLPAYVLLAVAAGYAAGRAAGLAHRTGAPALLAALVLWAGLAQGLANWRSYAALARDDDTRRTVTDMLSAAPPDAAVLSNWHWYTAMQYLQQIEGLRPDALVDYVYPRGEPLPESWVKTIRATLPARPVVVNQFYESAYAASGLRLEPLGREAWLVMDQPRTELPAGLTTVDADFGGQVRLLGYALDHTEFAAGDTLVVTAAWTPLVPLERDYHFFVHMLGPDGVPLAQSDRVEATTQLAPGEVLVQRHVIPLPVAVPPGAYRLTAGVYDVPAAGGFARLTLPDGRDALPLAGITLTPSPWPAPTQHPRYLRFAGGPELVGYDYEGSTQRLYLHWLGPAGGRQFVGDQALPDVPAGVAFTTVHRMSPGTGVSLEVLQDGRPLERTGAWGLPAVAALHALALDAGSRYVPLGGDMVFAGSTPLPARCDGAAVRLDLAWLSARPLVRDRIVSVHLAGDWFAQSDSVPALGAIPTLKWIHASRVDDRHVLQLPASGQGNATAELVVYDAFTGQALAVLDPDIARQGAAVNLGTCAR